jgi:hypothetical protein
MRSASGIGLRFVAALRMPEVLWAPGTQGCSRRLPGGGTSPPKEVSEQVGSLFIREIYFYCGYLACSKWG